MASNVADNLATLFYPERQDVHLRAIESLASSLITRQQPSLEQFLSLIADVLREHSSIQFLIAVTTLFRVLADKGILTGQQLSRIDVNNGESEAFRLLWMTWTASIDHKTIIQNCARLYTQDQGLQDFAVAIVLRVLDNCRLHDMPRASDCILSIQEFFYGKGGARPPALTYFLQKSWLGSRTRGFIKSPDDHALLKTLESQTSHSSKSHLPLIWFLMGQLGDTTAIVLAHHTLVDRWLLKDPTTSEFKQGMAALRIALESLKPQDILQLLTPTTLLATCRSSVGAEQKLSGVVSLMCAAIRKHPTVLNHFIGLVVPNEQLIHQLAQSKFMECVYEGATSSQLASISRHLMSPRSDLRSRRGSLWCEDQHLSIARRLLKFGTAEEAGQVREIVKRFAKIAFPEESDAAPEPSDLRLRCKQHLFVSLKDSLRSIQDLALLQLAVNCSKAFRLAQGQAATDIDALLEDTQLHDRPFLYLLVLLLAILICDRPEDLQDVALETLAAVQSSLQEENQATAVNIASCIVQLVEVDDVFVAAWLLVFEVLAPSLDPAFAADLSSALDIETEGLHDHDASSDTGSVSADDESPSDTNSHSDSSIGSVLDQPISDADDDSSEEESLVGDEGMAQFDGALTAVFAKRNRRKEAKQEAALRLRLLDFPATLCRRTEDSQVLVTCLNILLETATNKTNETEHPNLAAKASRLLKATLPKVLKKTNCRAKDLEPLIQHIHFRIRSHHSPGHVSLFVACNVALIKQICASGGEQYACEVLRGTLLDFATRKSSPVPPQFLASTVQGAPTVAWALRHYLMALAAEDQTIPYRKVELVKFLALLMQTAANSSKLVAELPEGLAATANCLISLLEKHTGNAQLSAGRLNDVCKSMLNIARIHRNLDASSFSHAWLQPLQGFIQNQEERRVVVPRTLHDTVKKMLQMETCKRNAAREDSGRSFKKQKH